MIFGAERPGVHQQARVMRIIDERRGRPEGAMRGTRNHQ